MPEASDQAAAYVKPGRCPDQTVGPLGSPLSCDLSAGHSGMHHDDASGADWHDRPQRNVYPMVQIRPLTVTEWDTLRSVLRHAGQVHQAVSTGPGGVLRIDQLPSTFAAVYLAVTEANSVEPTGG